MRVRGVITKQGTDISDLINGAAGDYADSLTGVLIAESTLDERSRRDGIFPDISAGLSHVLPPNLGYGTYAVPPTLMQLVDYREYIFQPPNAISAGWRYYAAALERMDGDVLWAALSYNRGPKYSRAELEHQVATDPAIARRFERYRQSLKKAEEYRVMPEDGLNVSPPMREKLAAVNDYPILDSEFLALSGREEKAECVQGAKARYIASPVDGWKLHVLFGAAEA